MRNIVWELLEVIQWFARPLNTVCSIPPPKIPKRTTAFAHLFEWVLYQSQCFSHRKRQMWFAVLVDINSLWSQSPICNFFPFDSKVSFFSTKHREWVLNPKFRMNSEMHGVISTSIRWLLSQGHAMPKPLTKSTSKRVITVAPSVAAVPAAAVSQPKITEKPKASDHGPVLLPIPFRFGDFLFSRVFRWSD